MNYDVKHFCACLVASCRMGGDHSVHGSGAQYFHMFLLLLHVMCLLHQRKGEANGSETGPWSGDWCYCSGCCVSTICFINHIKQEEENGERCNTNARLVYPM